MQLQVTYS